VHVLKVSDYPDTTDQIYSPT